MLNLIHTPNEKNAYLSPNALSDLNISFFSDAEFIKYADRYILCEKDAITTRQREFTDILNNPRMGNMLDALSGKLSELSETEKSRHTAAIYETNESLLYAFRELLQFTDCIDIISAASDDFSDSVCSDGFKALFDYAKDMKSSTWYANVVNLVSSMDNKLKNIKSVTVGINLDAQLRPMEAGIVSLNTSSFTTNSIMDRLFAEKADSKEYICLSVLCKNEFGIGYSQLNTLSGQVYSSLNEIFRRSLIKMKGVMNKAIQENNYLNYALDEIRFLNTGAGFILKMKAAGMPVCIPEFTDGDEKIRGLYDPNLIGFTESASIVKNDISFDEKGRIYVLTGNNSGGKSVFLRSVGLCYVLFQLGMPIPAESAEMRPTDGIYTHFIGKASMKVGGRLENECKSISEMCSAMTENSLMLMDESFSSTSAYDGTLIATEVLTYMRKKGSRCVYATHMHDVSAKADEINEVPGKSAVDLLSVETDINPHKIERKRGAGKSFAMEIFKKYGLELK